MRPRRAFKSPITAPTVSVGVSISIVMIGSNNYLGLANHPRIVQAAKEAVDRYGVGPAAVRSIAGTMDLHVELERRMAAFKGVESAITFQSGFNANVATILTELKRPAEAIEFPPNDACFVRVAIHETSGGSQPRGARSAA